MKPDFDYVLMTINQESRDRPRGIFTSESYASPKLKIQPEVRYKCFCPDRPRGIFTSESYASAKLKIQPEVRYKCFFCPDRPRGIFTNRPRDIFRSESYASPTQTTLFILLPTVMITISLLKCQKFKPIATKVPPCIGAGAL
ncbi:hypothetical protein TNCV_1733031 [Trichonephila clavipes]|nr:hypothetical protein TNCV_1733031 [Trichonephila clavipes]